MTIPENVGVNDIQASIFGFLYKTFPHLHQNPFHHLTEITKRKVTKSHFYDFGLVKDRVTE